ncbi:MAG: hypothetical protein QXK47_00270 [Candidatus Bathyarchaeia archaeon]
MRKTLVVIALITLSVGVFVSFSFQAQYSEQVVAYDWTIHPRELAPPKEENTIPQNENEFSTTGLAFISITKTQDVIKKFPKLTVIALELNVTASQPVRVIVGRLIHSDPVTFDHVIFNSSSTTFSESITTKGTEADFLEIRNEGDTSVNVMGNVKVIGEIVHAKYPYMNIGTLIFLSGLVLLVYGIAIKPKKRIKYLKGS